MSHLTPTKLKLDGFDQRWNYYQQRLHSKLDQLLPQSTTAPHRLHKAMRYACLGGGKRLRAILVYACGELFGADQKLLDFPACAVECIHSYSLIHDDMPAMDNDDLRRGQATVHKAFDEGTALLAGDALQAYGIEILLNQSLAEQCQAKTQLQLISTLAHASGSHGMAGGQGIDLESVGLSLNLNQLEIMHKKKTGALICASALMGAICSENLNLEDKANLLCFADHLGLLFQITDDILDEISNDQALGKTAGKDKSADKPTYISTLGLTAARDEANIHHQKSIEYLLKIDKDTRFLVQLTDFILNRSA